MRLFTASNLMIQQNSVLVKFKRDCGNLYWLGVKENKQLNDLYKNVATVLSNIEVSVDRHPYKPH